MGGRGLRGSHDLWRGDLITRHQIPDDAVPTRGARWEGQGVLRDGVIVRKGDEGGGDGVVIGRDELRDDPQPTRGVRGVAGKGLKLRRTRQGALPTGGAGGAA